MSDPIKQLQEFYDWLHGEVDSLESLPCDYKLRLFTIIKDVEKRLHTLENKTITVNKMLHPYT